jgi:hypothetical protein
MDSQLTNQLQAAIFAALEETNEAQGFALTHAEINAALLGVMVALNEIERDTPENN